MFRRAAYLLHLTTIVSKTSHVSIFPIHLDPPTLQHREIFKLLLGMQEKPLSEENISEPFLSSSGETFDKMEAALESSSEVELLSEHPYSCSFSPDMDFSQQRRMQRHGRRSNPLVKPKYSYMESFARSIQNHSQLAPFDDIILVPNTRYPISLAQSTNLAALTVLAARGLPHVHVDFTALEHPDASMPVIYDLTQRYPDCVLVHWLHDAYEMQRWKNFSTIKLHVPLMLLKTVSLPVSMFAEAPHLTPDDESFTIDQEHKAIGGDDDDNIEVSKSYYNSGSFSWLGATSHKNSTVDLDSIGMADADSHRHTDNPSGSEYSVLECAATPLHSMKNAKGSDASDDGRSNTGMRAKDILVSADGFVKFVDEDCQISSKGTSNNVGSTSNQPERGDRASEKEGTLSTSALRSILLKMPPPFSTSSTSTPSTMKELEQVKHELRDIFPAAPFPSPLEAFQPFDESNVTEVRNSYIPLNAFNTDNGESQQVEAYEWDTHVDNRVGEHCKKRKQLRFPSSQNAQRNVRELLDDLYQPLNYHLNHNDVPATLSTNPYKQQQQPVDSLKNDADSSRANPKSKENSFIHSKRGVSMGHTDYEQASGRPARSPIDPNRNDSLECSSDAQSSAVEPQKLPVVEVHSVVRTTGADVRQALWEQEIDPFHMLSDCILQYIDSYMLYRDPRKTKTNVDLRQHQSGMASYSFHGVSSATKSAHTSGGDGCSTGGARRLPVFKAGGYAYSSHRNATRVFFETIIPRLEIHYDKNNPIAREKYETLRVFQVIEGEEPDLIVPIGGDGYMMHCIRKNWRRFIPFYGVNAGHVGYLLNDCSALNDLFLYPLMMNSTNMLYCQAEKETGNSQRVILSEMAFNDAWVERSSGQSAFIRILVNGEERIKGLRADGVLVSTAAGSTAYSRAVGASPIPVGVPLIQVVGSNVVSPSHWQPVHLNQEDVVEFEVLDHVKRPCRCFVDAVNLGNILRMQVRSSRVAGVTLAFSNSCDLRQKLFQLQFPKMD